MFQFDLMAASSELHAVTSILFWDGPDGALGEFDFGGTEDWLGGICQCCYAKPFNQVGTDTEQELFSTNEMNKWKTVWELF